VFWISNQVFSLWRLVPSHFQRTQVEERIWLVSCMQYDLGFFDRETCRIESAGNPFAAKVSPMSPV